MRRALWLVLCATLTLAACDDSSSNGPHLIASSGTGLISSTPTVTARVAPQTLPIVTVPTTASCAFVPGFATAFDLIFVSVPDTAFFVDRVTFRLNDGSSVGGPSLTFPRRELDSMFGSTLITGSRAFPFHPVFGCGLPNVRTLFIDVTLVNRGGSVREVTATAKF
jgi:hypothetical protein